MRKAGADMQAGSPPRVRSRHHGQQRRRREGGITSACAEQTCSPRCNRCSTRDHLRVCGADTIMDIDQIMQRGSPPRVRSRLPIPLAALGLPGITSACAEQTAPSQKGTGMMEDHLRVCGADAVKKWESSGAPGSPPRVRSRHPGDHRTASGRGITSACAEQTVVFYCVLSQLNGVEYLIYALRRVS